MRIFDKRVKMPKDAIWFVPGLRIKRWLILSVTGSVLAAFVLTYLQEFLRFLKDFRLLIYPLILIVVMLYRPQGLLGMKELSFVKTYDKFVAWVKNRKNQPKVKKEKVKSQIEKNEKGGSDV